MARPRPALARLFEAPHRFFALFSTLLNPNWWSLGMAGRLPDFLCPRECIGAQERFQTRQTSRTLLDLLLASQPHERAPARNAERVAIVRGVVAIGRFAELGRLVHACMIAERAAAKPTTRPWRLDTSSPRR